MSRLVYASIRFILRVFYYLIYHPLAWTYDGIAHLVSAGYWQRWVLAVMDELDRSPGTRILELGHGPGHLQKALAETGLWAIGIDRSPQMGRQAFRNLRKQGSRAALARAVAQSLPLSAQCVDQVVATFPTDYIIDRRTLQEIKRVLKPAGRLVVLAGGWPTGQGLQAKFATFLFRITGQAVAELEAWKNPLADPIQAAGFRVELVNRTIDDSQITLLRCWPTDPPAQSSLN